MKTLLSISLTVLFGCAVSLPEPTEADLQQFRKSDTTLTLQSITDARAVYIRKCSGCHSLYLPGQLDRYRWKGIVDTMSLKAKINQTDKEKITGYLLLYSSAADSDAAGIVPYTVKKAGE